jgi:anti-sigma regulatory factor (Ser/Thr protein kinase)
VIESRAFANDTTSVTRARHFVTDALRHFPRGISDSAALIVSELATNAIRHARQGFTVRIEMTETQLRAEVTDVGGGFPTARSPQPLDPTGRGLQIVDSLSQDWGVTARAGGGKTVWFTLCLPPDPRGSRGGARSSSEPR